MIVSQWNTRQTASTVTFYAGPCYRLLHLHACLSLAGLTGKMHGVKKMTGQSSKVCKGTAQVRNRLDRLQNLHSNQTVHHFRLSVMLHCVDKGGMIMSHLPLLLLCLPAKITLALLLLILMGIKVDLHTGSQIGLGIPFSMYATLDGLGQLSLSSGAYSYLANVSWPIQMFGTFLDR